MSRGFAITYAIEDSEWSRTAATRWDPEAEPLYDSFYGDVEIHIGNTPLFGDQPINMCVADLACGLAHILQTELPLVGDDADATFHQSDDALEIRFRCRGDRVEVTSNFGPGALASTTVGDFSDGVRRFIRAFTNDMIGRVPDALHWKDLSILRSFTRYTE